MVYKILVPIGDKRSSKAQLDFLCKNKVTHQARIILLAVIVPVYTNDFGYGTHPDDFEDFLQQQQKKVENLLLELADLLKRHNQQLEVNIKIELGNPTLKILDIAKQEQVDCILIGSHGRSGVERFFLGSVSQAVVQQANCSVTVVRKTAREEKQENRRRIRKAIRAEATRLLRQTKQNASKQNIQSVKRMI